MQPLDVPSFPLVGRSLIEASAGTGKTFTISALYNRIITGHNSQRLGCDKILLVTFTEAATEELRGRIRQRVQDSFSDVLRLLNQQPAQDQHLAQYIEDIAQQNKQSQENVLLELKDWLQTNLNLMDEATIFTIHGFCGKMLKRFAFDSGVMFSAELSLDSNSYLMQACEDVWRRVAYSLDFEQSQQLLSSHNSPESLFQAARSRIHRADVKILPSSANKTFADVWHALSKSFKQCQALAAEAPADDIQALIQSSSLDKRSYSKKHLPNWIQQTYAYLNQNNGAAIHSNVERFTPEYMAEKSKDGVIPEHPLFNALAEVWQQAQALQNVLKNAWLEDIKTRYFELLEQAGILTPDDLLRLLAQALESDLGAELAEQIRTLYPVAMIDEFQDTDPTQYGIFSRIYPQQPSTETSHQHALIMIGDPKQAIYAFRGADIFTYIKAKRELDEPQRFTLDTNWRSHSQLIDGVNRLFTGHATPFVFHQDIPYQAVKASGIRDANRFQVGDDNPAPLQFWFANEESNRYQAQQQCALECAEQINQLLSGEARLGSDKVEAKDIAILVRTAKQAQKIRDALNEKNISSVFLTRDSVFKTQEAQDLLRWLHSVAHPNDERALRSALISITQNYSAAEIDELLTDEDKWESALVTQQSYLGLWLKRGIMAAIMSWLEADNLAVKLRQATDGERRLTNLMHLGDLLQQRSRKLRGHEALLRWFSEQVLGEDESGAEAQLRLESDANLVSIITIHKSKGLQYPLVFLPYLWDDSYKRFNHEDVIYFDTDSKVKLHLDPGPEEKDKAEQAKLAENVRLLYVALTRAEQGCFVWLKDAVDGRSKKKKKTKVATSALGYLLGIEEDPDWQALSERLQAQNIPITAAPLWLDPSTHRQAQPDAPTLTAAYTRIKAWDNWRVSSYSQLTKGAATEQNTEPMADLKDDESQSAPSETPLQQSDGLTEAQPDFFTPQSFNPEHIALTFVKGANAGTCLHDLLEHWDFHDNQHLPELVAAKLYFYGIHYEEEQLAPLVDWLNAIVQTPLADAFNNHFSLQQLDYEKRLDEMEFFLPVAGLTARHLENLLGSSQRFHFNPLTGYLKGFIDLIFCHNGRYYVADYKSNHLGFNLSDYAPENLTQAMQKDAYDLQAWIYTLALDAILSRRIENYQPEKHLGGVYYFFVRGMHLGEQAPVLSAKKGQPVAQAPGVYYHKIDHVKLKQWQAMLKGETA